MEVTMEGGDLGRTGTGLQDESFGRMAHRLSPSPHHCSDKNQRLLCLSEHQSIYTCPKPRIQIQRTKGLPSHLHFHEKPSSIVENKTRLIFLSSRFTPPTVH